MNTLNKGKTGLTFGLFVGGWHLLWSLLVLSGLGQPLVNFVLWAHMIHIPYVVGPFEMSAAAVLVVMTFVVGYLIGWLFAYLWNMLHRAK